MLNSCRRAHGAGYRHGNQTSCLKGTQESVLSKIEGQTEDFKKSPIFWLNGLAGTGKSTIAQTLAELVFANGHLGASFFCSRGVEDHSDLKLIFPTFAFQLAQKYPCFQSSLLPLLQSNPDTAYEPPQHQMQSLPTQPLQPADTPTAIAIDALDECKDKESESAILLVLGQSVSEVPRVKFFITCRPEAHTMSGLCGPLLKTATDIFILHHVELSVIHGDIFCLFKHELSMLVQQRGGTNDWPIDEHLNSLCSRAAGLFVYAVATLNFLKHKIKRPWDLLDMIVKSPESTTCEGKVELEGYTSLDFLYASILQNAFSKNDTEDDAKVCSVLSAVVLVVNPLPLSAIATLLGSECDVVLPFLESIQSLLVLHDDVGEPVYPFHKSFPNFITDSARCIDMRFHILPNYHTELVLCCLKLMDKLEWNMCSLPDYALNSEVKDCYRGLMRVESMGLWSMHAGLGTNTLPWWNTIPQM